MRGAYLTPEAAAGDYVCRRLSIPIELLHIVTGALADLTVPYAYEEHGTMTPDEAAALMLEMLNGYQQYEGECDMFIGMVAHFTALPHGVNDTWLLCDGTESHLKVDFPDYWTYLENTGFDAIWGVDETHFKVPDLRDRFILGSEDGFGDLGGEETHTLTIGEMPAHTHTYNESNPAASAVLGNIAGVENDAEISVNTGSTGGGGAHNNMPPFCRLYPFVRVRP